MKQVPNIFTLLNLLSGCLAIVFTLQTEALNVYQGDDLSTTVDVPEKIAWAAVCIGVAAIIDFLDGFIARMFHAESELGKQLDSLCDVVSFGVAPAMILYQFLRMSYLQGENALEAGTGWLLPAFIFALAGAFRLARFNTDPAQAHGFKGVPIPAAGLVVASLPLIAHYNYFNGAANALLLNKWFLYSLIAVMSWLMVSTLPLMAFKFKEKSVKANLPAIILLLVALVAAIVLKWLAVPLVFICYIALSLTFKNKTT